MDLFKKCHDYETVRLAKASGAYPYFIPLDENEGTEVVYEGGASSCAAQITT